MKRQIARVLFGLLLVAAGLAGMMASTQQVKDVISPPRPARTSELPTDPLDLIELPENRKRMDAAKSLGWCSLLAVNAGFVVIVWPVVRAVFRVVNRFTSEEEKCNERSDGKCTGVGGGRGLSAA